MLRIVALVSFATCASGKQQQTAAETEEVLEVDKYWLEGEKYQGIGEKTLEGEYRKIGPAAKKAESGNYCTKGPNDFPALCGNYGHDEAFCFTGGKGSFSDRERGTWIMEKCAKKTSPDYSETEFDYSDDRPWRRDLRCGEKHPLKNGDPAQCNPETSEETDTAPAYCCSNTGWCGATAKHCPATDGIEAKPRSKEIKEKRINYAKINVKQDCSNHVYLRAMSIGQEYFGLGTGLGSSVKQCCTRAAGLAYPKHTGFPHKVCPNYPSYDKDFSEGLKNVIKDGFHEYLNNGR